MKRYFFTVSQALDAEKRYNPIDGSQFGLDCTSPILANFGKPKDAKPRVYVQSGYDSRVAEGTLHGSSQRLLLALGFASSPVTSRFLFSVVQSRSRKGGDFHEADVCVPCS
jgi:hypothetical protein